MRKILLLLILFILVLPSKIIAAQVTLGSHDKLVKVCDLPDTDDYKSDDGKYFDFGYKYTLFEVVFLPIFQEGEGEIIGYIDEDNFVVLSQDDIDNIAKTNNIKNLAGLVRIPFWDSWGGKIVGVFIILLLIGSLIRDRYRNIEE